MPVINNMRGAVVKVAVRSWPFLAYSPPSCGTAPLIWVARAMGFTSQMSLWLFCQKAADPFKACGFWVHRTHDNDLIARTVPILWRALIERREGRSLGLFLHAEQP